MNIHKEILEAAVFLPEQYQDVETDFSVYGALVIATHPTLPTICYEPEVAPLWEEMESTEIELPPNPSIGLLRLVVDNERN